MGMVKSYITDTNGQIKSVILNYEDFKKLEELILDLGLAKAMEEIKDEEEISLEEAKKIIGFKNGSSI